MVSVIIPIYNVEQHINKGIANFLRQTYQEFELLLVDDGSTDDSLKLCKGWETKDNRIHVYHKDNGGAGSARNLGIEKAQGEYIYFFDIDDLADDDLLDYCTKTMDETGADMMVFSYRNEDVATGQKYEILMDDIIVRSNAELRDIYVDQFVLKMNGFPWNKMYRKSFLNMYYFRFEDLLIQQDEVFNLSIYPHVSKAVISSKVFYTYFIYNRGNTRSRFIANRFDIYKIVNQRFCALIEYWNLHDERLELYLNRRLWQSTLEGLLQNLKSDSCSWSQDEKQHEVNRISNDTNIQKAIAFLHPILGFEQRLYMKAILSKSILCLLMIRDTFVCLRKVKRFL